MTQTVPPRTEIAVADRWAIESIFSSVASWQEAAQKLPELIKQLARFQGHLADGPETLLACLEAIEEVLQQVSRIRVYASLDYSVDMAEQEAAARNDRARSLYAEALAATAFAEPEILALGREKLEGWMAKVPQLATYQHYFDSLLQRAEHVREPAVEALLKQVLDSFNTATTAHRVLVDADLAFEPAGSEEPEVDQIDIAQSNINALITHENRQVRRTAWENYADAYLQVKSTLATIFAAGVKQDVFLARARNYGSSLEAALAPNHIPVEVFQSTIETFQRHLPVWHRYWRVRREALGYDKLHIYDIKAPLTSEKPHVPFEQAVAWICEGMQPLGEEYVEALRRGAVEERWVDKYPNLGKRSGAFSSGTSGTHPFIFMSYNDDLFSLSTLAHELGHSLHSYLTWTHQPFVYSRYTLFVAEVASNFNQALVRAHLLQNNDDPQFQIAVLEEAMSNFHRYFFIMPTLARFELEAHQRVEQGKPLTADSLNRLMADLFAEGYGAEVEPDRERTGITWAQFPNHMYANFYVYQYTTGIAAAHALAKRVLEEGDRAVEDYLAFLRAGNSLYPLEALQMAGVDMTSSEPMEAAFAVLAEYVDRLEMLTG